MRKSIFLIFVLAMGLISELAPGEKTPGSDMNLSTDSTFSTKWTPVKLDVNLGKTPLYFISNKGQVDKKARFYAKASRYTLWLTKEGLIFDSIKKIEEGKQTTDDRRRKKGKFARDVSQLILLNANKNPKMVPMEKAKLRVNYFKGNNPSKWNCDIPTSQAVLYENLYKKIDLKVYGIEEQVEYDWMVKPGGNPDDIRFKYKNVKGTRLDEDGNLLIETEFGELMHKRPVGYQNIDKRIPVEAKFKRIGKNTYGFEVGEYDKNYELIIDPVVLTYSTYLGKGLYDWAWGMAVDNNGNVYVTGYTESTDFPILNQYQGDQASQDVFVTRLDTNQSGVSSLIYSTYLGGGDWDRGIGIAADDFGNAYVAGITWSTDFPVLNQYQAHGGYIDAFVLRLDTNLSGASSLIYSTYLGGSASEGIYDIAIDRNNDSLVYVNGDTTSSDFPILNQYQGNQGGTDAYITLLDTSQSGVSSLVYSTYLGGSGRDISEAMAVDGNGNVYVTGFTDSTDFPTLNQYQVDPGDGRADVFVTRLDTNQSGTSCLIYSTYLGGSENERGSGIAVDDAANVYVTGLTDSSNFPTLNQYQGNQGGTDAYITRIDTNQSGASSLIYSTYLGGEGFDKGQGIAQDLNYGGIVYVTGYTGSSSFPTLNQFQEYRGGGDAYVTGLDTNLGGASGLIYSTYLGGGSEDCSFDISVDSTGNIYVAGFTDSTDFPILNQYQEDQGSRDVFVAKLSDVPPTIPTVTTAAVSDITSATAACGGDVTGNGGAEVTCRGVCWSTSENPTTDGSHTTDGSGTGVFTSSITNLTPNTVYHVRAYATNAEGTAYGNEKTFETDDPAIIVIYPNGGEILVVGSGMNITWNNGGFDGNVKIEYSIDNGQNWTGIVSSTENDGSYPWTVPAVPSYQCLIRISEVEGDRVDTSDGVFTIAVSSIVIPAAEREALIALYNSTDGFQWLNDTNWKKTDGSFNDPGTEHTWYGITVENNHVKYIFLSGNELGGTLPAEIGNFPYLSIIHLSQDPNIPPWIHEPVSGPIPATIGNLTQLRDMDLSGNDFSGNIPVEIGNLINLDGINLSDNELTGSIPASLGNLVNLQFFACWNNRLSGSLPDSLTNLVNLIDLDLRNNDIEGNIPANIGNLTKLYVLDLSFNALTGAIPSSVGNLVSIDHLLLNGNKLSGSIPTSLTDIPYVLDLDIGYNALYTDDDTLIDYLDKIFSRWKDSQTIAPSGVWALPSVDGTARIWWTPIIYTADDGGYRVLYSTTEGGPYSFFDMTADKTVSSMAVTGLAPGTTYYFVVQTRTLPCASNGNTVDSEYSEEVSVTTPVPIITIISPNGGENLYVGSVHTIFWSGRGAMGNVMIQYSSNNGGSWKTIVQSTENDGRYNWNVPATPSADCLVRISEVDADGGVSDVSDAPFAIVTPVSGTLTIRSPNGGESWTAGSSRQITWSSTGDIDQVTIKYSTDNGTTWKNIAQSATNSGSYNWVVPNTVSDQCLVRITANSSDTEPIPSDVSDAVFSIVRSASPAIEVTAPNGGEQLVVGSPFTVTWETVNSREAVKIEYSVNGGESWVEITGSTENNGKYNWTVPDTPSDNCLVRVSTISGQPVDISDAVFAVVQPVPGDITVTSPNGGESWTSGSSQEIKWTGSGIDNVVIEYSRDNGTTWEMIVQTTPNSGSFDWTIPGTISSDKCLVRITSDDAHSDPKPSDVSDAVFSILPPASPSLRVIAPNGEEQLVVGSRFNVTWEAINSREAVTIEYSLNGGQTWATIIEAAENTGDYDWIVPDTPSETCLVRVGETGGQLLDISDAVFAIVQPVPGEITVTSPNGGESWTVGSLQEIKWTGSGINNVTIDYSTDSGATWQTILQTTPNSGSFDWTIPDTVSDECLVRVSSNDGDPDPIPSDVGDQVFSIALSSGAIKVTSPNGGEEWEAGTIQPVTWTNSGDVNSVMIEYSPDNGTTWNTIVSSVNNNGTYDWTIPDAVSEECLVRVTANDGDGEPKPSDTGDSVFSIVLPSSPSLRVITPNGGEQFVVGTRFTITWSATDPGEDVKIEYSVNGGESWTEITGAAENDGGYGWIVPDEPSGSCLVRVSETDGQPVDISDAVFSITSN